ncbi:hypothetical protein AMAG_00664 [Allomyces macrogynus ATCC 38327]|uniref:Cryptic loci regulator 2 N-terminal domain-containing protein n=1 Tax=Allomyces macrogynus (strain ATCC 38327) TaxID=578462 RepID=A0A0L0RX43_ALLM3|nr:hypothetical protein AMAG_00664 [Allomyces macrogynus ATCC 38327]|eukprot:KNE54705.1 hypothetical protein AMAG_00664 [Allomyces macrogynus ATCC 38327]
MASPQQGFDHAKEPARQGGAVGGLVGAPAAAAWRRPTCSCQESDPRQCAASGAASRHVAMGTKRADQAARNEPHLGALELAASLTMTLTLASTPSSPPTTNRARAAPAPANSTRRAVDAVLRHADQPRPAAANGQQDNDDGAVRPQPPPPQPAATHQRLAVPAARTAPTRPPAPPSSRRVSPSTLRSTAGSPCQQQSPLVPTSATNCATVPAPALASASASASNSAMLTPPTFTDGVTLCWPAEILGQIDRDHDHEARVAARLGLCGFPPGYAAIKRTKPSGRSDRYIYGHPSRRTFRSVVEFKPHVEWLLLVSSDPAAEKRDPCSCLVCHPENKVKKPSQAKSGKSTAAASAAASATIAPSSAPTSAPTTPKKRKREVVVISEPSSSSASSPASTAPVPSIPPSSSSVRPLPVSSLRAAAARARALSKLPIRSRAIPKSPFHAPALVTDTLRDEQPTVRSLTHQQHSGSGATWPPSFSQSATPVPTLAAARQSRGFASFAGSSQGAGQDAGPQDTAEDTAHAAKKRRGESNLGFGALASTHPLPPRSPLPEIDVVGAASDDEERLCDVLAVGGRRARPTSKSALLKPTSPVAPTPPPPPSAPMRIAFVQSPPGPVCDAARVRGEPPATADPLDLFVQPPQWPAQPGSGRPRPPGEHGFAQLFSAPVAHDARGSALGFNARPPLASHLPPPPRDPRLPPAPAASRNLPPPPQHVAPRDPRDPRLPPAAATSAPFSPAPSRAVPRDPRLALAASTSSSPTPLPPRPIPRDPSLHAGSSTSISAPPSPAVPRDPRLAPGSSASSRSASRPPPPSRPAPRDPRLATTTRPGPYSIPPSRIVSSSTARSTLSREQEERLRKSGNWGLKGGTAGRGTPPAPPGGANDPRQVQRLAFQRGAPRLVPYGLSYPGLAGRAPPIVPLGTYTLPPPPVVPHYGIGHHAPMPTPPTTTTRSRASAPPPTPAPAALTRSRNRQFQQVRRIYLGGPAGLQARRPVVVLPVPPPWPPPLLASSSRTRGSADQSVLQIPTSSSSSSSSSSTANPAPYPPAAPQRPVTTVRSKPSYARTPISVVPEPTTTTRVSATAPVTAANSLLASSNAQGTEPVAPVAPVAVQGSRDKDAAVSATTKPIKRKFELIVISDSEDDDQIDDDMAVASEEPFREDEDVRDDNVEAEGSREEGAAIEGASADDADRVKVTHAATAAVKEPARNDAGATAVRVERVEVARAAAQELVRAEQDTRAFGADNVTAAPTTTEKQYSPRKSSEATRLTAAVPDQLHPPLPDVDLLTASEPATSPPPKRPAAAVPVWDDEASAESVPMTKAPVYDSRGVGSGEEDGYDWRGHHARRKRRKVKHEEPQPQPGTGQEKMTAEVDALLEQVDRLSLQGKPFPRFSLLQVCWMTLTKDEAREIDEEIMRDRKAQNQPWNDIVRKDPDADLPSDCDSDVDAANPEPWLDPKTGTARRHRRSHLWPVMVLSIYRHDFDPHEDELFMDSERVNEVDAVDPATLEYTVVKLPLTWYWRHLFALTEGLEDDADPRHFTTSRFYRFLVETAWQDFKDTDQLGGALDRTAPPMIDVPYEHHPPLRPIHQAPFLHRVAASRLQHFRTLKERPSRAAPLWSSTVMQAIALDASWEVIEFDEEEEISDFDEDVEVEEVAPEESRARRTRTASAASGAAVAPAPVRPPVTKELYFLRLGSELITRGDDVWVVRNSQLPSGDYATPLEQLRRGPTPTELPPSVVRMCTRREVEGMQRLVSGNDAAADPIIMMTRSSDRDTLARVKLTTHTVTRFPPTEQRRPYLAYGMDRHLRMIDVVSTSVEARRERWGSRRITA